MSTTKTRKEKVRPGQKATPQGNESATLLKAKGEAKEQSLADLGLSLISQFSFSIPSGVDDDSSSDNHSADLGGDVSFTKMLLSEAMDASGDDLSAFVRNCEATSKALKDSAKGHLKKVEAYYLAWASGFPMSRKSIGLDNSKGSSVDLDKSEFERSTKALLYAMGKISNNSLFGKPATDGKAESKSIFRSPSKVAKLEGFSGENETHTALAEVNFLILDKGGYVQKSLELIGTLAKQLNARNAAGAAGTYQTLKGNSSDSRFGFEDWAIIRLAQARIFGMFAAQFDEQARQAKKAIEDKRQYAALSEADRLRVEAFKKDLVIARNKAEDKAGVRKVDTIAESKIASPSLGATDAGDLSTTLNRLRRELADEMAKPETSEDTSIQLRSKGKVSFLLNQIAALDPDSVLEAVETAQELEPTEETADEVEPVEVEPVEETIEESN